MSALPPPVAPRKHLSVRGGQLPPGGLISNTSIYKEKCAIENSSFTSILNAERELESMNHCFDDVERFMARLQQTAEAQSILKQRSNKRNRKSKKMKEQDDSLLALKARPPSEDEFVDLFQKIKYSLSLLDRLKSSIAEPDAPELLHHIFVPLRLMVRTTGGPVLAASVASPAMTIGAVSLLQNHLVEEEKELWTSLGPYWTSSGSHLNVSVPPYSPVFLDGWKPEAYDSAGQLFDDPVESQHKQDAFQESKKAKLAQAQVRQTAQHPGEGQGEVAETGLPLAEGRLYCCTYDFVARNSSELSVLQGETLEVISSSNKWWKCQNRFDQIGFVPSNILEPQSALNPRGRKSPVIRRESKRIPIPAPTRFSLYAPSSSVGTSSKASIPLRSQSMLLPSAQGEDGNRVMLVNDELLRRLAVRRDSLRSPVVPPSADTAPLNYHSPSADVEAWLNTKGFSQRTVQRLAILNGAQLLALQKEELRTVAPEEGARVYDQIVAQKALLEDVHKATELKTPTEKQNLKTGLKSK